MSDASKALGICYCGINFVYLIVPYFIGLIIHTRTRQGYLAIIIILLIIKVLASIWYFIHSIKTK